MKVDACLLRDTHPVSWLETTAEPTFTTPLLSLNVPRAFPPNSISPPPPILLIVRISAMTDSKANAWLGYRKAYHSGMHLSGNKPKKQISQLPSPAPTYWKRGLIKYSLDRRFQSLLVAGSPHGYQTEWLTGV